MWILITKFCLSLFWLTVSDESSLELLQVEPLIWTIGMFGRGWLVMLSTVSNSSSSSSSKDCWNRIQVLIDLYFNGLFHCNCGLLLRNIIMHFGIIYQSVFVQSYVHHCKNCSLHFSLNVLNNLFSQLYSIVLFINVSWFTRMLLPTFSLLWERHMKNLSSHTGH